MQLSIIIVNYNVKYFLEHCLLSVIKACNDIDAEILVVDNNSSDGSEVYLSPKFPSVKFYWNKTNPGFGKANNSVLKDAVGDYILFLNPDTIVPEDCFTKCISFFESHTDCGALGVRMIDGSGTFLKESKRSLPTPTAGFFKMIGLAGLFPSSSLFAKYYAGQLPEKDNNKVEVLAGAFMMLNKKAIELTNGFDESFFMYGEDIDLSYRITQAGLQNYYLGETTIIHFKGESTQKKSSNYVNHFYGAIKLFVQKHYSRKLFLKFAMLFFISVGEIFAKIKIMFSSNQIIPTTKTTLSILFYGTEKQFEKINVLLKNTSHCIIEKNIIESGDIPKQIVLGGRIKPLVNSILFCEGDVSNNLIIDKIQNLPTHTVNLFYENAAESVIGSNNKNEPGIFISTH